MGYEGTTSQPETKERNHGIFRSRKVYSKMIISSRRKQSRSDRGVTLLCRVGRGMLLTKHLRAGGFNQSEEKF